MVAGAVLRGEGLCLAARAGMRWLRTTPAALKDYYDVLGVRKDASQEEIKRAYKNLAKKLHPDSNSDDPNANDKFQEVQKAYDVLKDPEKRRTYDMAGHEGYQRMEEQGASGTSGEGFADSGFQGMGMGSFDDLFSALFGGAPMKGRDLRVQMTLDFMEAVSGARKEANVPTFDSNGQRTGWRRVPVDFPAGVDTGMEVSVKGEGLPGPRTDRGTLPPGDLRVAITVQSHPSFERDGPHIRVKADVPIHVAALGGTIRVPTLSGNVDLNIRRGTQPYTELRLSYVVLLLTRVAVRVGEGTDRRRGKGVRDLSSGQRGDEIVLLRVVVPTNLTQRQEELFRELADEERRKQEQADSWFSYGR